MTAPAPAPAPLDPIPVRRDGTEADIAGLRIWWAPGQSVDWDRKLYAMEAVAARKADPQLTPRRLLNAVLDYLSDPEAAAGLLYVLRRHRAGDREVTYAQILRDLDLTELRDEWIDADGIPIDLPPAAPPTPREDMVAAVITTYADGVDIDTATVAARAVIAALGLPAEDPRPAGDADGEPQPGEAPAGADTDPAPAGPDAAGNSTSPTT